MHGRVRPLSGLVLVERGDDVCRVLMTQLRHAVVGIGVLVVLHPMAAVAGVELFLAASTGLPVGVRRMRQAEAHGRCACNPRQNIRSTKHLNSPSRRAPLGALMLKSERRKCHSGAGARSSGAIALLEMHQQQRHRGGREPGNSRRLSERLRPHRLQSTGAPRSTIRSPPRSPCPPAGETRRGVCGGRSPRSGA